MQEHGCKTRELFSESHAIKQRLGLLLRCVLPATSHVWIPSLQMKLKKGVAADGATPPALSPSSNTSISPQKERDRAAAIAAAVLCNPLLQCRCKKSFFCIHVSHHSGLFDGTDHCQDADSLTKHAAELDNGVETRRILHSVGNARPEVHVCPARRCVRGTDWDNLISIDWLIVFSLH